jgi:1-acyl-sn-glycerol-3-phosphate acyltransferase
MTLLRSALFNIIMYATGAALSLYGRALLHVAPGRVLGLGIAWARISLRALRLCCNLGIEVTGRNHLPAGGPALIAAQHQSAFDTLVWLTLLPRPTYVLKQELLGLPLLGPLLAPSGFIAVNRAGGAAALRQMVAGCRAAAAAGKQIVIFPEGTRVAPGARATLQPGIVALARALDLPIIPVATDSGEFWGRNAFRKNPGRLRIRICPPLPAAMPRAEILAALSRIFYDGAPCG